MRIFGFVLILASGFAYGVSQHYLKSYRAFSDSFLKNEYEKLNQELLQRDSDMTMPIGGIQRLNEMRRDRFWMRSEINRRNYYVDTLSSFIGALGLALFVFPSLVQRPKKKGLPHALMANPEVSIPEAIPREEYVDEWEFQRRTEAGFKLREEAVDWISKDPLLKCDYCGGRLKPTLEGEREALEFVTFYKRVPDGARDMRVVLGSRWFTKPSSELKCSGCERVVKR